MYYCALPFPIIDKGYQMVCEPLLKVAWASSTSSQSVPAMLCKAKILAHVL